MTKRRGLDPAAAAAAAEQIEQQQAVPEMMGPADEIDLEMPGSFFNMGEDLGVPPGPLIMPIYGAEVAGISSSPSVPAARCKLKQRSNVERGV